MRKKLFFLLTAAALIFAIGLPSFAQNLRFRPLQRLIDCPSAGGPETKSYEFELTAFPDGGLLAGLAISPFQRFTLGVSYGGTGVIGYGAPEWNPQPGLKASFRIINESMAFPGAAVGFENQGRGYWDDKSARYQFIAKGFYAAIGKNFHMAGIGEFALHGGVSYNPADGAPKIPDYFAAFDLRVADQLGFIAEYSFGLNERDRPAFNAKQGWLNAAFRWTFAERLAVDVVFRDLLVNQPEAVRGGGQIGREVRIHYVESL